MKAITNISQSRASPGSARALAPAVVATVCDTRISHEIIITGPGMGMCLHHCIIQCADFADAICPGRIWIQIVHETTRQTIAALYVDELRDERVI